MINPLHRLVGPAVLVVMTFSQAWGQSVPQTVEATWADFDPHAEPLEAEVIREELGNGIVTRYVRYVVGTFAGKKTRVAAFYGFPEGAEKLPGIIQVHGGGQFARKAMVQYYAARGYAAIAVNWGEKVIDQSNDPNTEWQGIPAGFLEPKHHNGVEPGEGTIHGEAHPWNSAWLLYSAAARRAITFLEEQPECDGDRIGLQGHSMGGRLTVLTAIDPRIKAASPSVGGSGYLYEDIAGIPNSARRMVAGPERDLYMKTLDCRNYWTLIRCPVMFLGATNDFNSPMEFVFQGFRSLPKVEQSRTSFTPHMNHRFTQDNALARIRWFDTHLKNSFEFPKTASVELELKTETGIPRFTVKPDLSSSHQLEEVAIYYGYDRDPRARFWRSAEVVQDGETFTAACHVMEIGEPLFAFANVTYETNEPIAMPPGYNTNSLLTVTSEYRWAYPQQLKEAGVKPTVKRQRLIDDFANGWQDWSLVAAVHREHWNFETHKVNDPGFLGPKGASLAFEVTTSEPGDTLAVVLDTDRWRGYTGRKPTSYVAMERLEKAGVQPVKLSMEEFVSEDGEALTTYDFVTSLILTSGQKQRPGQVEEKWKGKVPTFANLRWEGGEFAPRQRPYLRSGASEVDADSVFQQEFDQAVTESVEREEQDRK
ncbi:MAG: acyl-CoA thioester hydrolase/BAAT C-terminal domain-containing protein [Verrucomicrobiota bacterium]